MKQQKRREQVSAPLPAREAAVLILEQSGINTPVQALLDNTLTRGNFSRQEASLVTELVYGYLRSEVRLSWLLSLFLKKPEKLPPSMRIILGMAAYELLYLDRIPAHASVNAAVSAVNVRFGKSLSRVANGVLRSFIRRIENKDVLTPSFYSERISDPLDSLSIQYSLPRWILKLWIDSYGLKKAEAFAAASTSVPGPCVRINTARKGWEELRDELAREGDPVAISGIRFLPGHVPDTVSDCLAQGKLSLQGAGSQLVLHALGATSWQGPVWDACAGRGGKTLMLLELGLPILAASDVNLPRLRGLRFDAHRLSLPLPPLLCASATRPAIKARPGTILLDVPCSGLGTLSRHPDLRTLRTQKQIEELVLLQEKILEAAWELLPSGGRIAYITCTVNPEENETQIKRFLSRHSDAVQSRQWMSTPDNFGSDLMYGALIRRA